MIFYFFIKIKKVNENFLEKNKNILLLNFQNDFLEISVFSISKTLKFFDIKELFSQNIGGLSSKNFQDRLYNFLKTSKYPNIKRKDVLELKNSLILQLENKNFIGNSNNLFSSTLGYRLYYNEFIHFLNSFTQPLKEIKDFLLSFNINGIIYFEEEKVDTILKEKVFNIFDEFPSIDIKEKLCCVRGASYFVSTLMELHLTNTLPLEDLNTQITLLESYYKRYMNGLTVGKKRELLKVFREIEEKIINSSENKKYLYYFLNCKCKNEFILGRYTFLIGKIGVKYPNMKNTIGNFFIKNILPKTLIKYKPTQFPEFIIFSILGLGKINFSYGEKYLLDLLYYPCSTHLLPYLIKALGKISSNPLLIEIFYKIYIQKPKFKREIYLALGYLAFKEKKINRKYFEKFFPLILKDLSKNNLTYIKEILFCVNEIFSINANIDEKVWNNFADALGDINIKNSFIREILNISIKKIVLTPISDKEKYRYLKFKKSLIF